MSPSSSWTGTWKSFLRTRRVRRNGGSSRIRRPVLRLIRDERGIAFLLPAVGGGTERVYLLDDLEHDLRLVGETPGEHCDGVLETEIGDFDLANGEAVERRILFC